jgi:hypothetical protein
MRALPTPVVILCVLFPFVYLTYKYFKGNAKKKYSRKSQLNLKYSLPNWQQRL